MNFCTFIVVFFSWLLYALQIPASHASVNSWQEARDQGQASLTCYWYTSAPFIYRNEDGTLTGIEFEIMQLFKAFIQEKYGVSLTVQWIQPESFIQSLDAVSSSATENCLAVSAFSITAERLQFVDFTEPYMSDLSVLISNQDVPIVSNIGAFDTVFNRLKAITIAGTTYEQDLFELRDRQRLGFEIAYITYNRYILIGYQNR
jgi:ABC-type amino acid transport substrate-binding protein